MRLVSVGNILVDIVLRVPALPERGGDLLAVSEGMSAGGSLNALVAAGRQGLPAAYAGGHGTGPMGDIVRAALAADSIAVLQPASGSDSGFDVAMIDAEGERTFVTVFGAEAELVSLPSLEPDDLVHVSGYGLLESTNQRVIVEWLEHVTPGTTVLFDPGPLGVDIPPPVMDMVRRHAAWLSCNEREAASIGNGWQHSLVRLGAAGCRVDGVHVPGFAVDAVDTNGAGDAHVGAFLAGIAAGLAPQHAARRANACAALAATRRGPATAPGSAEVDALLVRGHLKPSNVLLE